MNFDFTNWTGVIYQQLSHWRVAFIGMLPNIIVLASIVLAAFVFLGKFLKKMSHKILLKFFDKNPSVDYLVLFLLCYS